jgi:hypothetical protein
MQNNFLNKCKFYTFNNTHILDDLNKLYDDSITNTIINDLFNFETIDSNKINILIINWSRYFTEYYDEPIEKSVYNKQGFVYTKKFFEIVKKLSNKNFIFLIDNVMEANTFKTPELLYFLNKIKEIGISHDKLFLAYNNSFDLEGKLIDIDGFKINTLHFPHFFISTLFELDVKNIVNVEKTKDFLILNRRFRYYKYLLLNALKNNNLLSNSLFTILWVNPELTELIKSNEKIKTDCNELGINIDNFIPVTIPNDVAVSTDIINTNDLYLYNLNIDWFHKTKVNIVSETYFHFNNNVNDTMFNDSIHLTEKTWKAIHIGVPFVVSATNKHIETLHKFGFKTFDSIVNEDYDLETNPNTKINKIINSAVKLAKKYNTKEVLDIVEYNFNLFKDLNHKRKIVETFFLNPFEKLIMKNHNLI